MKRRKLIRETAPRSVHMPAEVYRSISDFILATVKQHEIISLQTLLDEALQSEALIRYDNLGWCLLQVKRDLEARGMIRVDMKRSLTRGQQIKLTRKSKLIR